MQTEVTTVPYKGTGPAMNDLMGGQFDFMCDQTTNTVPPIRSGKIKVYAWRARPAGRFARHARPEPVGPAGFEISIAYGVYAPKGLARPVTEQAGGRVAGSREGCRGQDAARRSRRGVGVARARRAPIALRAHLKAEIGQVRAGHQQAGVFAD